jgi:glucose-1-phosphate adenylyltransferase
VNVLTLILAGGKGTRLDPLTRDRAKPAVPFGGCYRIIDFTLSNCINSHLRKIMVLTQYKASSLDRHLAVGWSFLSRQLDEYIGILPPQQRIDESWYQGTADAIYQNIYTIEKAQPRYVLILAGDHIYKMDYGMMIAEHIQRQADLTIGCVPVPRKEGVHFGIMDVDEQGRVLGFLEKPANPPGMPGNPDLCLASMGIYVFTAPLMYELLCQDATRPDSKHDFGHHLIPNILGTQKVHAHRFLDRNQAAPPPGIEGGAGALPYPPGKAPERIPYWRDVGTLDAYYQANMDLIAVNPVLNLYDNDWPIHTFQAQLPPPKFIFAEEGLRGHARRGEAHDSIVCAGCILSGGHARRSILSPRVRINSYAIVEDSILLDCVDVGRHCRIRKAIVDKDVRIPQNTTIGYDPEHDRRRGFHITEEGIVVIAKAEAQEAFSR